MSFPQEGHAKEFHQSLLAQFASNRATRVEIAGAGVHWQCSASRRERSVKVHCFGADDPEYLVIFKDQSGREPAGRTEAMREAVEAVADWLDGRSIGDLHGRFAFVDRQSRALAAIEAEAVARHPGLCQVATPHLQKITSDQYNLTFKTSDRSCLVDFYGHEESPRAVFEWDECAMFWIMTGDVPRLSDALNRWLCDLAMPSEMAGEFPELELEPVASYYEQGRPLEGEFLVSWDQIERFYREDLRSPIDDPILAMIAEVREAGFDRTLRAGQSLWTLVVSRSRRHGLRRDQPFVAFEFHEPEMRVIVSGRHRKERFTLPRIGLGPEVLAVLNRLAAEPID